VERWSPQGETPPEAKVPQGTKKPPQAAVSRRVVPGRDPAAERWSPQGETPPEAKVPQGTKNAEGESAVRHKNRRRQKCRKA